ncbi:DUF2232 domain-containing protein [Macrococcoides canis]|uniref:DUF2232 domain-containing protein n=1 Tax=Macrococcoides canis TaxID=1855823 RepID=UPI00165DE725|nr:DUF2232 domain-containing protein [Macrococcus canis]QNR06719.1 DUF2232 domain-containing protein [Macrococcus canis]
MKIDIRKTIVTSIIMLVATAIMHFVPGLFLFIVPFLLIPAVTLYYHSKESYYAMSFVILIAVIFTSIFTMQIMLSIIFGGFIVGQLLKEKASKERVLYILTVFYTIFSLIAIIILQMAGIVPKMADIFAPATDAYYNLLMAEVEKGTVTKEYANLFLTSMDALVLQIPGLLILFLFILSLIQVSITFPSIRKFKVSTPNFRPLYMWRIPKVVLYLYFLTLFTTLFLTDTDVVLLGIVTNFKYVLEWIIFIQGLSLFSFFIKVRRTHPALNILIYIFAFIFSPVTQIFGMIDMILNLKSNIKRK